MSTCARIGCNEPATHALKMVVPDLQSDETSAEALLGIELCREHLAEQLAIPIARNLTLEHRLWFAAHPMTEPDFPEAYLEAVAIDSMEYRAFHAFRRPN